MDILLKKIVNTTLALIILDMLLPKAIDILIQSKIYPRFSRLHKLSKKIVGYR